MLTLTKKQARFVVEYALYPKWTTAKAAAIRAGYSPKSARQIASELMAKPHVRQVLDVLSDANWAKNEEHDEEVEAAYQKGFDAGSQVMRTVYRRVG
jgi:phage terminase small subunit